MAKHGAPVMEREEDRILPEETHWFVRALCYLAVYGLAALGFWCLYLEIFV